LLDNDDGISAPGIHALYDMLKDMCTLVVVAPSGQQSGMSHAVPNVSNGLKVRTVPFEKGVMGYAVDGTPAEAACLGVITLSDGKPFDLVVMGINEGENTGLGNLYSGTVNGGMEAVVRGTQAVAFSLSDDYNGDYAKATPIVRAIVRLALAKPLPPGVVLNVNIPKDYTGVAVLPSLGLSVLIDSFTASPLPNGQTLYTPNVTANASPPPGGDVAGYMAGKVTITPLAMNRTATEMMVTLQGWPKAIYP
jgi:5'-nucleotidase